MIHRCKIADFSNPYLRSYLARGYFATHKALMEHVQKMIPIWLSLSEKKETHNRPFAAVFDLDEVIFGNIHENEFHGVQDGKIIDFYASDYYCTPDGDTWPRKTRNLNPILPGAMDLLAKTQELEIKIYFISGRRESIRAETVKCFEYNRLASLDNSLIFNSNDLLKVNDILILRPNDDDAESVRPYKESWRKKIEETHHIVMNIGDQISDLGLYGDVQVHIHHPFYWIP